MSADETHQATILIVDDTPTNLEVLVDLFLEQGLEVLVANDGESALEKLELTQPDIILLDVMMPGMDGFETCQRIKQREATRQTPILFMTALSEISSKMQGFALGAVDYVTKPFQVEEVAARVETHLHLQRLRRELAEANELLEQRVAERTAQLEEALADVKQLKDQLAAENVYLREELELTMRFDKIVGESEAIKRCLQEVQTVAPTDATVLILGETGTGKEVFARAVHEHSRRKDGPMVKVNCAALPSQLVESELFGHEKGAFTGALERRIGRFELAHGGTIFLDEIGELPLELQAKLLRVLQEGEIERVGGGRTINVDVRVVAATNRDLAEAVERGTFREDLYYRINVFPLLLPALRERDGDIALLVRYFVDKLSRKIGREIRSIPQDVMQQLEAASWPGNVRELEHALERAVILSTGGKLTLSGWAPRPLRRPSGAAPAAKATAAAAAAAAAAAPPPTTQPAPADDDAMLTLKELERAHIVRALELTGGRVSGDKGAAKLLDINPKTLESRMKRLGINRDKSFSS